jgi:glutaredoxin 3
MPSVVMYSSAPCPYCSRAKALLSAREIAFEEISLSMDAEGRVALNKKTGMMTFPQIFVDDQLIGGFQELMAAEKSGRLSELLGAVA